ncbi:MAG: ZIP family metal transporter [Planctomycetaceae bacterium]
MFPAVLLLTIYCLLIVAASMLGGWLPSLVRLTHKRMQVMMSLVGGLMLGTALFHMLPHALHEVGPTRPDFVPVWVMAGLVTMFFLLRTFHFHHHDASDLGTPLQGGCDHEDLDAHQHDHDHDHDHEHPTGMQPHELSWLGVFLGLGMHTMIDGLALAASVQAGAGAGAVGGLLGGGTFLAIVAHKPLDAVSITTLMSAQKWSTSSRIAVNIAFALMCPFGAFLFHVGMGSFTGSEELLLGGALAFSAGVFLCISLSDLLPEMEFHSHHRVLLSVSLLTGILLAWLVHLLEPPHKHGSPPLDQTPTARENAADEMNWGAG